MASLYCRGVCEAVGGGLLVLGAGEPGLNSCLKGILDNSKDNRS